MDGVISKTMSESRDEGDDVNLKRFEPLFILNSEVDQTQKYLDTYEICKAVNAVVGSGNKWGPAYRWTMENLLQ